MPSKRYQNVRPVQETEPKQGSLDGGKNSLAVGIKGCPADLFLAQSVKFGQCDWYKVNNVLDPNFELVYNVRETNKITKESRIEWLIESVTSHQTANRILTENHSAKEDEQKVAGENGSDKEDHTQESKKPSHSVRKWLRRFWNFVKCPCTGLPKRNNKVADIFYQVDDTEE